MSLRDFLQYDRIAGAAGVDVTIKLQHNLDPLRIIYQTVEDIKQGAFSEFETGIVFAPKAYTFEDLPKYETPTILEDFICDRLPLWCRVDGPPNTITFTYNENMPSLEPRLIISGAVLTDEVKFERYLSPFLPVNKADYRKPLIGGLQAFRRCKLR
tara:strand:+ start:20412 stop:20879 length:468 start_codon:yes stop_codon:yes gene_type:complete